ncbi:MAG: hypothetical protein Q8K74_03615 [Candidatus Nitrotoga sp.]|nr:hypothetical protein [Candidatus Nitrotoga sp.]MDP1855125.1 hypothetical protein [Candidatus Nitrotoga sp.]MDP3497723.1 hypothetical protein [Candidatus Nitrotoga sp.]
MSANVFHQTIMAFSALAGHLPGRSTAVTKIAGGTSNTSKCKLAVSGCKKKAPAVHR